MVPNDPFFSAFQRLDRAKHHIANLKAGLQEYRIPLKVDKYTIVRETDVQRSHVFHKVRLRNPISFTLNAQATDAISNLRAALDHAAFAVVSRHAPAIAEYCYFPISDTSANWETNFSTPKARYAQAFPPEIIATLRGLQPYKRGHGDALWALNGLRRQSEHRTIIRLYPHFSPDRITFLSSVPGTQIFPYVEGGEDSVTFLVAPDGPQPEYNVDFTVSIRFSGDADMVAGRPIIETMEIFSSQVSTAIEAIAATSTAICLA